MSHPFRKLFRNNQLTRKAESMTNHPTTPITTDRWSVYRQERLIKTIERLSGEPLAWEVQSGVWAEYSEQNLRKRIERLTGLKFIFGFNPNDRSMVATDPSTHGWFIPTPAPAYGN